MTMANLKTLRETYQLKIQLDYIQPPIWRTVLVPSTIGLKQLNSVLLSVMGWNGYHMSEFGWNGQRFGEIFDDLPTGCDDWSRYRLDDLLISRGEQCRFTYDFGDGWDHAILLEDILPLSKDQKLPVCLSGARACPPEDIGGFPGYEMFLEAIADPKHSEYEHYMRWLEGDAFDPEFFEVPRL